MLNRFSLSPVRLLTTAALMAAAPLTFAHGSPDVSWSLNIGSPLVAAPVYAAPPAVYVQPAPVYVRPQPVYVQPAPVVTYGGAYYVEEDHPHGPHHPHHWHGHHH